MIEKIMAENEFNRLNNKEKNAVVGTLYRTRQFYIMSNITVDVPYFFMSGNPLLFNGIDVDEFLKIDNAYQFGIEAVYYISKYINKNRM